MIIRVMKGKEEWFGLTKRLWFPDVYNRTFGNRNQSNLVEFHRTIENDRTKLNSEKNWPIIERTTCNWKFLFLQNLSILYFKALTALFTNMRILKFNSQLTITFFAAVNHLNGPLRKQNFSLRVQKVKVCDLWLVDFDPFCVFLCFKVRCLWS